MKTVLLAEHHKPTLHHLRDALAHAGYTVRCVSDPGTGMEHFVADRPDAVVLAVDFPRLEGAHLGALIRGTDQGATVPVIAIDKGHLGKAKGVGAILDLKANGYVADPLKLDELLGKLAQLLQARDAASKPSTGVAQTLSKPPSSAGELRGHPLPGLLHSLFRLQRDGLLVVVYRELTRRVFLLRGNAVSYDSTARQDTLPMYLRERGLLTESQAEAVLQSLASGLRIGAALAEAGVELGGEDLLSRLREFTRDKVSQLIGMKDGRYAFYAGSEFQKEVVSVEIPGLAPILAGARHTYPLRVFAQALKPHLAEFPSRSPDFGKDLGALGLDTLDLKVAMQVNGRIPLGDLIAHGRGDLKSSYSLFWFLNLTGDVVFSEKPISQQDGQGYGAFADKLGPKKRKPLPAEVATELRDAAVKIITGSYFRVLGLDIGADTDAVERAYHDVAARFHPDTYPEFDTSEIQDLLDSVQDKLSASYRVLSLEEKRRAYLQYLASRLDVNRSSAFNVDAEIALKRGEAALKRKEFSVALEAFAEAVALNPREPEYYSYLAWATYKGGEGGPGERARAAQKVLKKALALNSYLERPQILSAIIEGESGEHAAARKKLLRVLELNPDSQLAKAALRKVGR